VPLLPEPVDFDFLAVTRSFNLDFLWFSFPTFSSLPFTNPTPIHVVFLLFLFSEIFSGVIFARSETTGQG
jgi:hypothetical protein